MNANEAYNLAQAVAVVQMGGTAVVMAKNDAEAFALALQYPGITFRVA